jgi:hypothetical protein
MAGWIKIHREITRHWIFQDSEKFKWWIDMLFLASYEDNKTLVKNQIAEVKRGQFIGSLSFFTKRWGVSKERVINFLKLLQSDGMIDKKSDKNITIITICNYESYQDVPDNLPDNLSDYKPDNLPDNLPDTTKEVKEVKEFNNNNLNARTREERVPWEDGRERGFGEQIKANQIMAIGRKFSLNRPQVIQFVGAFLDKCQIGDHGHRDIGHFGNHLCNFIQDELKRQGEKPTEQPTAKKVIEGSEIFNLYK